MLYLFTVYVMFCQQRSNWLFGHYGTFNIFYLVESYITSQNMQHRVSDTEYKILV